ncbi:MAG: cytochrome c peroxidase [Planctomycetota bacterium]|nr:cytochrome c peroxidase [Planctomycetota bacterium]
MRLSRFTKLTIALAAIAAFGLQTSLEAQRRGRPSRPSRPVRRPVSRPAPPPRPTVAPAPTPATNPAADNPFAGDEPFTTGIFARQPGTTLRDRAGVRSTDRVLTPSAFTQAPKALETLEVPPVDVSEYIADETAAIALGKALFWDQQMGSDGIVACASCHYSFGVDVRTKNTVAPGGFAAAQSPDFDDDAFYGPKKDLSLDMFPFHKKVDPLKRTIDFPDTENLAGENEEPNDHDSNILSNNNDVVGSAGISRRLFKGLIQAGDAYASVENGKKESRRTGGVSEETKTFTTAGVIHRAVTGRNAPTTYGAVYHRYLLWDGRAEDTFNGVDETGDSDKLVWKSSAPGEAEQVSISIENAALASQAVGPAMDNIETSFILRSFADLGQKMLTLNPLSQQTVDPADSVLGNDYLAGKTYADLVRAAFKPEWYQAGPVGEGSFTQMEENFSLFWGVSIMLYERTLIPDNTRYDSFARSGFRRGFTDQEKEGLSIFLNEGKCINCHEGPFFAGATFAEESVENMAMQFGSEIKVYDSGFYNIGVTPTAEDIGRGGIQSNGQPLSDTLKSGVDPAKAAVDGSFKSNTLRNIEYTGPYMHNGSMKSLREVIEFYARGGNHANEKNRSPDVNGVKLLREDPSKIDSLIAFLRTLTDNDARISAAPFDHPSLSIANGKDFLGNDIMVELEATGRTGLSGDRQIREFEDILADGGLTSDTHKGPLEN